MTFLSTYPVQDRCQIVHLTSASAIVVKQTKTVRDQLRGTTEIDFAAKREDELCYFQVTASMLEESTFEREMKPLRTIRDNYPKTVITLDAFSVGDYEGIKVVNAVDWLLKR